MGDTEYVRWISGKQKNKSMADRECVGVCKCVCMDSCSGAAL